MPALRSSRLGGEAAARFPGELCYEPCDRTLFLSLAPTGAQLSLTHACSLAPHAQTLDPDNKGYVEAEKIRTLLTTHGERFSQEEIDDFIHFAVDAESGLLHYEDYVSQVSI